MEEKSKTKSKPKEKMIRANIRIEEKKINQLEKIFEKKYPTEKNTTTNQIKKAIDFFIAHNQNIKIDDEIKNINDEISAIKNLNESEKIQSYDNRVFKNLQKNFNLKFSEEEILFLIKHIYKEEISQTNYIDQKNSTQIFLFGLQNEEEFFLRMKNFIFTKITKRHQLKPHLYEILYRQIYQNLPRDKEDIELFYEKFAKDIYLLNEKMNIAIRKSIFQDDEELKNFQKKITPKISKIKKCVDELLKIMEKCNEKK